MERLAQNRAGWALPWPCVHEFIAIVTHPKVYAPPSTLAQAIDQVEAGLESPSIVLLTEGDAHWGRRAPAGKAVEAFLVGAQRRRGNLRLRPRPRWETLRRTLEDGQIRGPQIHDARIAALCLQRGISELWTADRDFGRIAELRTRSPLIG